MSHHRFINDGRSAIPMGASAEYGCVCGKRGTREAIAFHIAEMLDRTDRTAHPIDDFLGGDTKAHYFPHEPRRPAPTGESPPLTRPDTPDPLPPAPMPATDAWPAGTYPIAELFQSMLRLAFEAGGAAASSGESFETWYQREVLR